MSVNKGILGKSEKQFLFLLKDKSEIKKQLIKNGFKPLDYPEKFILTIYFSNVHHYTPKKGYIRARHYSLTSNSQKLVINDEDIYNFEVKSKNLHSRDKKATPLPFKEIKNLVTNQLAEDPRTSHLKRIWEDLKFEKLIPFIATQYYRNHYQNGDARITVDEEISVYGFFNQEVNTATKIWQDLEYGKLEIKNDNETDIPEIIKTLENNSKLTTNIQGESEKKYRQLYDLFLNEDRNTLHSDLNSAIDLSKSKP